MSEPGDMPTVISFGPFHVDLETKELRRKGLPVRLPAQSFEVLRLLLSRPGKLVSRQELQRALWPKESFGDFEHGLNAAVNRLREALGDSADAPRFVETLPRRGYRFIGSPDFPAPSASTETAPQRMTDGNMEFIATEAVATVPPQTGLFGDGRRSRLLRSPVVLVSTILVAVAFVTIAYRWRVAHSRVADLVAKSGSEYAAVRVVPLTALPGSEVEPTFSPDGNRVAFAWDGGHSETTDSYDLYVKAIGSDSVQQMTHQPAEWIVPAWSPDGRSIAFFRRANGVSGIFLVPAFGGPERKLVDAPTYSAGFTSLSWSSDGQKVAYDDQRGMRTVSVSDGTVHAVAEVPGCLHALNPSFSPDGKWLAFNCILDPSGTHDLSVIPANGGAATRLTQVNDQRSACMVTGR